MKRFYLLSALPPLRPTFDAEPPLTVSAFWQKIQQEDRSLGELVQAILLEKDIANLQEVCQERRPIEAGTIPLETLIRFPKDHAVVKPYLPEPIMSLLREETWPSRIWKAYFQYAFSMAEKRGSRLSEWIEWDLTLKNVFQDARSQRQTRRWATFSFAPTHEHERIVETYRKAQNPLEAEQALDRAKWEKISSLCVPYSFQTDEIMAYALHLLILQRWWIISRNKEEIIEKVMQSYPQRALSSQEV